MDLIASRQPRAIVCVDDLIFEVEGSLFFEVIGH